MILWALELLVWTSAFYLYRSYLAESAVDTCDIELMMCSCFCLRVGGLRRAWFTREAREYSNRVWEVWLTSVITSTIVDSSIADNCWALANSTNARGRQSIISLNLTFLETKEHSSSFHCHSNRTYSRYMLNIHSIGCLRQMMIIGNLFKFKHLCTCEDKLKSNAIYFSGYLAIFWDSLFGFLVMLDADFTKTFLR